MAGRANKYDECVAPRLAEISEWSGVLSEKKIAKRLGVSTTSFETYKAKYPELKEALQNGKTNLVTSLKEALMKKALGFRYTETKTVTKRQGDSEIVTVEKYDRYSPPDTGAAHLLLKNLDESWRNDDQATMDLKREKLSLEKDKAEADNW